jgi:hypothetical protein
VIRLAPCACSILTLACGAPELPPSHVEGSLPAFELALEDAIFVATPLPGGGQGAFIHLTELSNACDLARDGQIQFELAETRQARAGSRFVTWTLVTRDAERAPIAPGTVPFAVPDTQQRGVVGFPLVGVSGDRCQTHEIAYDPSRVRLELDRFEPRDGGIAEGSFEIAHRDHRLHGRFRARYCALSELRASELPCRR